MCLSDVVFIYIKPEDPERYEDTDAQFYKGTVATIWKSRMSELIELIPGLYYSTPPPPALTGFIQTGLSLCESEHFSVMSNSL